MACIIILISADVEWKAVCQILDSPDLQSSPYGDWFEDTRGLIFFHGGWGKIAAAGSTQYVIDRWQPDLMINLGTCGGFAGEIEREEIILAERTLVYDIIEQMGDYQEHLAHYTTLIDLTWLGDRTAIPVRRTLLVSADRDLLPEEVPTLYSHYGAIAGDWESGAIAWVAARNRVPVLILRGVTDLVSPSGGEAYGNITFFGDVTVKVMRRLVDSLPDWLQFR